MSDRSLSEEVVRVHLENASDIQVVTRTEEKEPEYFSFATVIVANGGSFNLIEQVCALDLLRKEISFIAVDSPVVVCHSIAQAMNPANQVANVPFPQGAFLPVGTSLTLGGTGPIWVVATVATASRVSVAQSRRAG